MLLGQYCEQKKGWIEFFSFSFSSKHDQIESMERINSEYLPIAIVPLKKKPS